MDNIVIFIFVLSFYSFPNTSLNSSKVIEQLHQAACIFHSTVVAGFGLGDRCPNSQLQTTHYFGVKVRFSAPVWTGH